MARPKRRSTIGKSNYIKGKKAKLERVQTEETEEEPIMRPFFESNVHDEEQIISDEDITDDEEIDENELNFSETELVNVQTRLSTFVSWTPGADQKGRPTIYHKKDPCTIASHEKKQIKKAAGSRHIDEMFGQQKDLVKVATKTKEQQQVDDMKECASALAKYADPHTKIDNLSFLQRVRLSTLYHFFTKVSNGVGKMEASEQLSRDMWQQKE
ncbi:hypothetical protein INT45_001969 [Circinella minor]|uniref:Uncharacterized protein n=1 Tax=Circinella minor TaxID=1195481 RepID=A0A8H7VKE1_9FUNG|nr:hypothetical protein INT45_001969 [Circinella minor]